MKTIKLTSYIPEACDHPEYCNDEAHGCNYLEYGQKTSCNLFLKRLKSSKVFIEKCDECKEHYKLSKQIDKTTNN